MNTIGKVKAEIITIGDEILIGQIVDTNSVFIAKALNSIGIAVHQISSIQDDKEHILNAFKEAESRADIIIVTGGLGPTKDDITKQTFCEYFDDELVQDPIVLKHVIDLFNNVIGRPPSEINKLQAMVPSKAIALHNAKGTAPGLYMKKGNKTFVSLPGVPHEMRGLITNEVIPKLKEAYHTPYIYHRTVITQGVGESVIAEKVADWENNLPEFIKLAYLPNLGMVRLRLSASGDHKEYVEDAVEQQLNELLPLLGDIVIGYDEETLPESILKLLKEKGQTLSLAESCTGGLIAVSMTELSGVSSVFRGSMVTYQTATKTSVLGVDETVIEEHSVVSAAVAKAMVIKVKEKFETDYAIATTGNAGPTKGDADAEIGTVYIGIATPSKVFVKEYNFGNQRIRVMNKAKNEALSLLRKEILKN